MRLFFRASKSSTDQITDLFNFVWPTAAALWNLRWQVQGYVGAVPGASGDDLVARFVQGSGIRAHTLRKTCIEQSWSEQQERFAKFVLVDVFAIYEGWLEEVLIQLNMKTHLESLQFPTRTPPGKPTRGVGPALTAISSNKSPVIEQCFYNPLMKNARYSIGKIENLMICYRCFKELRNSFMHRNGIGDLRAEQAYQDYSGLTNVDLGVNEAPVCPPVVTGHAVGLSLRGVVGFSDVILRLIVTIDAELAVVPAAEREIQARWKAHYPTLKTLKADQTRRYAKISSMAKTVGYPALENISVLDHFLKQKNLIT